MKRFNPEEELNLSSALGMIVNHAINNQDDYLLNRASYVIEKLFGSTATGPLSDWLVQCGEREASQ